MPFFIFVRPAQSGKWMLIEAINRRRLPDKALHSLERILARFPDDEIVTIEATSINDAKVQLAAKTDES